MKEYHVIVKRQNENGEQWEQPYVAVFEDDEVVSVMNVLNYIYEHLDNSLAYFNHAACKQAACGKCTVRVNGKIRLSCKEPAAEQMLLEAANNNILRDLICRE